MIWRTHLAFGFLTALIAKSFVSTGNIYIFFTIVLLGSILPDIDHPNSKVSSKIPILPKLISIFFKHRGLFHTIFLAFLIPAIIYFFIGKPYGIALFIGYMSHLLIDGFTVSGINFLHPFSNFKISGFVETGTITETITFIVILLVIGIKLL